MSIIVAVENFSLEKTAESGQCFRWEKIGRDSYWIPAFDTGLRAAQPDKDTLILDCSQDEYETVWKKYFDLEDDYSRYFAAVDPNDSFLVQAAKEARGVRILRQELWETIVSFIISQNNNIPRIKQCIRSLCDKFGQFPTAGQLAHTEVEELKALKLGYRSGYLTETAARFDEGIIAEQQLRSMDYNHAKACLMQCKGIGAKVADCICLFGLHHIEAFPVDTWIRQVVEKEYNGKFPLERYEGFAGIIQQFIFYSCTSFRYKKDGSRLGLTTNPQK